MTDILIENGEICIKKCPNVHKAVETLTQNFFIDNFNRQPSINLIKIVVDSALDQPSSSEVVKIFEKIAKKFSIILFQFFDNKSQIFWKFGNEKICSVNFDSEFSGFLLQFLESSMENYGHSGISVDTLSILSTFGDVCELDLLSLADCRDYNLMMLAAECGDESAVNFLLKQGFDVNFLVLDETAVDLAWDNQHFGVVLQLLNANSTFPSKFNFKEATAELKEFANVTRNLYNCIRDKKVEEIVEIVNQHPNLRHFYTTRNISAASKAALSGNFKIYDLLMSYKIFIGPKEDIHAILKKLDENHREDMRGINLKYVQNWTKKHLMILTTNSFVGHDIADADKKLEHVTKAFDYLDKSHPLVSIILKVVAASRDFKIIFDFQRDSVQYLDPPADRHTRGIYHTTRHIYIAAKQLVDPNTKLQGYGTLAHELCHYAIHLVYHNNCRPYYSKDDEETIQRFAAVTFICQMRSQKEILIAMVFQNYPQNIQHAELIVRVPHMIVEYSQDEAKLPECHENFPEIFDFFEHITAVDMKNSLPNIEIEADAKIQKFADRTKKQKRHICGLWMFVCLLTACMPFVVWLTLWMVHVPIYSCGNLTDELRMKIFDSTVDFQGVNVIFSDLFGENSTACEVLTTDEIMNMLKAYDSGEFVEGDDENQTNFDYDYLEPIEKRRNLNYDDEKDLIAPIKKDELEKYKSFKNIKFRRSSLKVGQKVAIKTTFYVERKISIMWYNDNGIDFSYIPLSFDKLKKKKLIMIVDGPGSGKSTAFRHLTWKFKQAYPLRWVTYVDMKQHFYALKQLPNFFINLTAQPSDFIFGTTNLDLHQNFISATNRKVNITIIAEFLATKIFNLTSKPDQKIFKEKFMSNQVIFLWDGFDEVSPYSMNESVNLFDAIRKSTDNFQWIATRPGFHNSIKRVIRISDYRLEPYDQNDRTEFITKFLASNGYSAENITVAIAKVDKFAKRLEKQGIYDFYETQMVRSPLMLNMICKSYSMSISLDNSTNLYSFYEFYVKQLFDIVNKDKGDGVKNDADKIQTLGSFREIHQHFAVIGMLSGFSVRDGHLTVPAGDSRLGIQKMNVQLSNEIISRYGILFPNMKNELDFDHRTFREFFFAQYFYDNVWNLKHGQVSESEARWRLMYLFAIIQKGEAAFKVILDFIDGFTEAHAKDTNDYFNEQISFLMKYEFDDLLGSYLQDIQKLELITKFFQKDREVLRMIWKFYRNRTFFNEFIDSYVTIEEIKRLKEAVGKFFSGEESQKIIHGKFQSINILHTIWKRNQTSFHSYIENLTGIDLKFEEISKIDNISDFLKFIDFQNFSIVEFREFFCTVLRKFDGPISEVEFFWEFVEKKLEIQDIKQLIKQKSVTYNQTHFFKIIRMDESYVNFYLNLTRKYLDPDEITELLMERNRWNLDTFMSFFANIYSYPKSLDHLWKFAKNYLNSDQKKAMLTSAVKLDTFYSIFRTTDVKGLVFYRQLFLEVFTKKELIKMLMTLDEKGETGVFRYIEENSKNENLSTEVAKFIEEIFINDYIGLYKFLTVGGVNGSIFNKIGNRKYLEPYFALARKVFREADFEEMEKAIKNGNMREKYTNYNVN